MPNEPKEAKEKRTPPQTRRNAQGNHEGSAHTPDEFDVQNPRKQEQGNGNSKKGKDKPQLDPAP